MLVVFVVWVNYTNYIQEDNTKLAKKVKVLEKRIVQEKDFSEKYMNKKLEKSSNEQTLQKRLLFDGDAQSYSESMGSFQGIIDASAKDQCRVNYIKWGSSVKSDGWYDRLRMNVSLNCQPKRFVRFENLLRDSGKLIHIESFRAFKNQRNVTITFILQLVGYRTKETQK